MKSQLLYPLVFVFVTLWVTPTIVLAQSSAGEVYTVQAGDWLSKLAEKYYSNPLAYPVIVSATNAKALKDKSFTIITNPDTLQPGQRLWIPSQLHATPRSPILDFPLNVGNTWIYSSTVYDGWEGTPEYITRTSIITEMVVATQVYSSYFAAGMRHEAIVVQGPDKWKGYREAENYWYVISGTRVYKQKELNFSAIEEAYLEYIFSLSEQDDGWYPGFEERKSGYKGASGKRTIGRPPDDPISRKPATARSLKVSTPLGDFEPCFEVWEQYTGGSPRWYFCPRLGVVGEEYHHGGSPFGYQTVLIDYILK